MTTEPYTPDEAELIGCYAGAMEEQAGEDYATAKADAERGIAKIRADVLREAAESARNEAPGEPYAGALFTSHAAWLDERADRIEEEA